MSSARGNPTVMVIGEHQDGRPRPTSLELITAARRLAGPVGGTVTVAVAGSGVDAVAQAFAALDGVNEVLVVDHPALAPFLPGPWVGAVTSIVRLANPIVVLVPSSITGRDYAARVAARLGVGIAADATGLGIDPDRGSVTATRAVLGSRVETVVSFPGDGPAVITVAPGSFPAATSRAERAPVRAMEVTINAADLKATMLEKVDHKAGAKALTDAERIVSGGRGLGKAENFAVVEELADAMGATVGASGATVGAGWRSHSDQVGSTGHIVSPKLYVAVGISGAPQHIVGMIGSENVVAINRDPEAPIFKVASFGIVGDLFEVVPAIVRRLQAAE